MLLPPYFQLSRRILVSLFMGSLTLLILLDGLWWLYSAFFSMRSKIWAPMLIDFRILPNDIISIVQSKLPTKDANKMYIYQGASITSLDFDDSMLYSSGKQNILGGASFSAPVNRVFILHNNAPSKHWENSTFIIYALSGNPTYLLGFILPSRSKFRNLIFLFIWMDAIFCPCLMWIVESIETKARFALEGSCWCMPPKAQDSFSFTYHILRYILYLTSFFQLPILEELPFIDCDLGAFRESAFVHPC